MISFLNPEFKPIKIKCNGQTDELEDEKPELISCMNCESILSLFYIHIIL